MDLIFDENKHKYYLDGENIPSVTQIISNQIEHVDWSKIPDIEKYKDSGSIVHKNLETYLSGNKLEMDYESLNEVKNFNSFIKYLKKEGMKIKRFYTEKIVHYKNLYAGKFDLLIQTNKGYILVDFKNGEPHREAVRWQCSMYALALKDQKKVDINKMYCLGNIGKTSDKFCCLELKEVSEDNIKELVDAYNCGYQWGSGGLIEEADREKVAKLLKEKAKVEEQLSEVKSMLNAELEKIKAAMSAKDKKKWDYESQYGKCTFTITEDYTKTSFDSKRFEKEHKALYDKYLTTTQVSGALKANIG